MDRTIPPDGLSLDAPGQRIIDVRRPADLDLSVERLSGSVWLDPSEVDSWCQSLSDGIDVIVYCVRGGSVSNSVVDALHAKGVRARYIEGGIEGWKAIGGSVVPK
ncbi:MAG: sulfurtransferase [Cyanobium sp.]|nr:MAG: sulfurtransferase [Cyanobium sp.]